MNLPKPIQILLHPEQYGKIEGDNIVPIQEKKPKRNAVFIEDMTEEQFTEHLKAENGWKKLTNLLKKRDGQG